MGTTLTVADTINGGAGTDTLAIGTDLTATTGSTNTKLSNLEKVEFTADLDQDLSVVGHSITSFVQTSTGSYLPTNNTNAMSHEMVGVDQTSIAPVAATDGLADTLNVILTDADVSGELGNASARQIMRLSRLLVTRTAQL